MQDERLEIVPPLTLAVAGTSCWKCHTDMKVVGLIASNVTQLPGAVVTLQMISDFPDDLVQFIQRRVPDYRPGHSQAGDYLASHCPSCGAIAGDFYLFTEPGGPFWPETEQEVTAIRIEPCPLVDSIRVHAGYGEGLGEYILSLATPFE